jgi:hypothetical protein
MLSRAIEELVRKQAAEHYLQPELSLDVRNEGHAGLGIVIAGNREPDRVGFDLLRESRNVQPPAFFIFLGHDRFVRDDVKELGGHFVELPKLDGLPDLINRAFT